MMKTEVEAKTNPVATRDHYRVTVTGLPEDSPALLAFFTTLTLPNGSRRRLGQVVRVTDLHLLKRLRAEVQPGCEIRVSTEVDNSMPDCPTVLKDFCPV